MAAWNNHFFFGKVLCTWDMCICVCINFTVSWDEMRNEWMRGGGVEWIVNRGHGVFVCERFFSWGREVFSRVCVCVLVLVPVPISAVPIFVPIHGTIPYTSIYRHT